MAQAFHDFSISPAERQRWRRAADELLINAIFGTTHDLDELVELELAAQRRRKERALHPLETGPGSDALFTPL